MVDVSEADIQRQTLSGGHSAADISKENISVVDKSTVDISVADIPVEEFLDKDVSAINLSSAPILKI